MRTKQPTRTSGAHTDVGPVVEDFGGIETLNEFYAAYGWDCRYRQIGQGVLRVEVMTRVAGSLVFGRESVSQRLWGHAKSADGMVSVIVSLADARNMINGRQLETDRLFIVPPNTIMDIVLASGADALTVLIPIDLYDECAASMGKDYLPAASSELMVICVHDGGLEPVRQLSRRIFSNATDLSDLFLDELCRAVKSDGSHILTHDPYNRFLKHANTMQALEYIHEHLADHISMEELCEFCGTSLSTLERNFKRFVGVTPRNYIATARLNRARRDLLNPDYFESSIAEIAMRNNLLHMGRFSENYRELFGRLPSEERQIAANGDGRSTNS